MQDEPRAQLATPFHLTNSAALTRPAHSRPTHLGGAAAEGLQVLRPLLWPHQAAVLNHPLRQAAQRGQQEVEAVGGLHGGSEHNGLLPTQLLLAGSQAGETAGARGQAADGCEGSGGSTPRC